jgi:uncharacterized protein
MTVPRFWREIPQRYNLQASRCTACQAIHFPPRQVCPTCRRASIGKMEAVKLSGRGRILESTRVHKAAPGYELQVPYVVALVQTEEGPIVTGQIVDCDPAKAVAGAPVRAVFRKLGQDGESGVIYYGTKWQLEAAASGAAKATDAKPAKKDARRKAK